MARLGTVGTVRQLQRELRKPCGDLSRDLQGAAVQPVTGGSFRHKQAQCRPAS